MGQILKVDFNQEKAIEILNAYEQQIENFQRGHIAQNNKNIVIIDDNTLDSDTKLDLIKNNMLSVNDEILNDLVTQDDKKAPDAVTSDTQK